MSWILRGVIAPFLALVVGASLVLWAAPPAEAGYGGGYGGTSGGAIWALAWWLGNPQGPGPFMGPSSAAGGQCVWHDAGGESDLVDLLGEAGLPASFFNPPQGGGHPGIWGVLLWAGNDAKTAAPTDHFDLVACHNPDQVPADGPDTFSNFPRIHPKGGARIWLWCFFDTVPDPPPGSPPPALQEAYSELQLLAPTISFSPDHVGGTASATVVNVATWFWVDGLGSDGSPFWRQHTVSATAGPITAVVWATPETVTWTAAWNFPNAGDDGAQGTTLAPESLDVVCDGPGLPYGTPQAEAGGRTPCTGTFLESSQGTWQTLTATVTWDVHWAVYGATSGVVGGEGVPPDATTTAATHGIRVMQVESIIASG